MPRLPYHPLSILIVLVSSGFSAGAAEIELKPSVTSRGSLVLLGDIAKILDRDPKIVASLGRIELFPAPAKGQARTVRAREIRELLRLNGVDLRSCKFSGAAATRIATKTIARPSKTLTQRPSPATQAAPLVVVALRPLASGTIVSAADIELRAQTRTSQRISTLQGRAPLHQLEDAVGLELLRAVRADQPLEVRMLRRPLLVRRGDAVQVTARGSGVTVRTSARAMQEGAVDDLITLQSETSREKYLARVTGLRQAEVFASGTVVPSSPEPKTRVGARRGPARR